MGTDTMERIQYSVQRKGFSGPSISGYEATESQADVSKTTKDRLGVSKAGTCPAVPSCLAVRAASHPGIWRMVERKLLKQSVALERLLPWGRMVARDEAGRKTSL